MAVYGGLPSIRLEGDKSKALALIPQAKALLGRVQSITRNAEVSTYSLTQRIDADSYIYALQYEGGASLLISVSPEFVDRDEVLEVPVEFRTWPDFISGYVVDGVLQTTTDSEGRTRLTLPHLEQTSESAEYFRKPETGPSDRMAVRPFSSFDELKSGTVQDYSQYVKLKPTMYSGAMAKCVQVLMGQGKMPHNKLDGLPKSHADSIRDNGVQIRYDYKFVRTHLIYMGQDWNGDPFPWLIEISLSRGVLAMPLPLYPRTGSAAWANALATRGYISAPGEVQTLFGGLPTGQSFPASGTEVDAKIARGEILRLLTTEQMSEFYDLSAYSSSCGWTTNARGTEAHNTGYLMYEDGFQKGFHYRIDFNIGQVLPPQDRLPDMPIVTVYNAKLTKVSEGWLTFGFGGTRMPFKIWEPLLFPSGGLLSHDSRAPTSGLANTKNCDTTVFVAHISGQFKLVKFYRNLNYDRQTVMESTLPEGQCELGQSWTVTSEVNVQSFPPQMYTSDLDDRHVPAGERSVSTISISQMGFGPPAFQDLLEAPAWCTVRRSMYYKRETRTVTQAGEQYSTVVAVPAYHRNAYYYSYGQQFSVNSTSTTKAYDAIPDPNYFWGYRKFPSGPGSSVPGYCSSTACGGLHTNRKIICHVYSPYFCSEFADGGQWAQQCQDIEAMCRSPQPTYIDSSVTTNQPATNAKLFLAIDGENAPVELPHTYAKHDFWLIPSPDPVTSVIQTMYAVGNTFGRPAYVYNTNMSGTGDPARAVGIPDHNSFVCFVGVF